MKLRACSFPHTIEREDSGFEIFCNIYDNELFSDLGDAR